MFSGTRARIVLGLLLAPSAACGDNVVGGTATLQMCLINALQNCERQIECGLLDDLEAARCPGELRDLCCLDHDCNGELPVSQEERHECIAAIDAKSCEEIAEAPASLAACLGWE